MKKVLVINTSPRNERSKSRKLTTEFIRIWKKNNLNDIIIHREVGMENIPHVDEAWIAGAFTKPELRSKENIEVLKTSDYLIDEFLEADIFVVGVPMYNWSIPSGFKAYIDQIFRIGRTWDTTHDNSESNHVDLISHKKMYLISVRGGNGYEPGGSKAYMNFQTPYLKFIFGMMGINDISEIYLENEEHSVKLLEESLNQTYQQINNLLEYKGSVATC